MTKNLSETIKHHPADQFIAGGQILTNIEDYSLRVRSEADAYAKKVKEAAYELKTKVEQDTEKALQKKLAAEGQAAEILAKAKEESEVIVQKARKEGFDKGYSDAEKEFKKEISQKITNLEELLASVKKLRQNLFVTHEKELLSLSMIIAQKIVATELKSNPDMVLAALRRVFKNIDQPAKIRVYLNPSEYEYVLKRSKHLTQYLDDKNNLLLREDEAIKAGNSKMETEFSDIEVNIKTQFKQAEKQVEAAFNERKQLFANKQV